MSVYIKCLHNVKCSVMGQPLAIHKFLFKYIVSLTMCSMYVYVKTQLIFIGSILNICCIRYNYMFRPWMLAIVRLYMKNCPVVIQLYVDCLWWGGGGDWEVDV